MQMIHCNNHCGRLRMLDECEYYFTACGHILCQECNSKIRNTMCPVCKKQTKTILLQNLDMKIAKLYFGDSFASFKKSMETHKQAWEAYNRSQEFQRLQEQSFQKIVAASIQRCRAMLAHKEKELKHLLDMKNKAEEREEAARVEKQKLEKQKRQQQAQQQAQHQAQQRQTQSYQRNVDSSMFVIPPTPAANRHVFTPENVGILNRSAESSVGGQYRMDKNQNTSNCRSGEANIFGTTSRMHLPSTSGLKFNGVSNGSNSHLTRQPFDNGRSVTTAVASTSRLTIHSPKDMQNHLQSARLSPASSMGGRSILQSPNSMASGMYFRSLQKF